VFQRPYWVVARALGLEGPAPPMPCQLGLAYQGVRNAAAALEMTGLRRRAVFGLLYDERNPYFAGSGVWPGWVTVLRAATEVARQRPESRNLRFAAASWQQLLAWLPKQLGTVVDWAAEKHGLVPTVKRRERAPRGS
jgi:hypothetical protein